MYKVLICNSERVCKLRLLQDIYPNHIFPLFSTTSNIFIIQACFLYCVYMKFVLGVQQDIHYTKITEQL